MKRKILLLAVTVICMATLATGTLAYFTSEDQIHNVITSDAINIQIQEWQQTENGLLPYPKNDPIEIMPGTKVSKIATIKNLEAKAYIRAGIEIIIYNAEGKKMDIDSETLASIVSVNINDALWLRKNGDDQWWYYSSYADVNEATEAFFTEVIFDGPNMTNEYQNNMV